MVDSLPVVFVHGIRLSGACWTEQSRLLADLDVRSPDLPGHGSRRGETFDLAGAVEAVAEAARQAGGRALLVGHSLGGYVAIASAARHPGLVAGVVGVGCTLVPGRLLRGAFTAGHRLVGLAPDDGEPLSAGILRRVLPPEVARPTVAAGIAVEVVPDVLAAARSFDPRGDLRRISGRVTLVNGTRDHFRLGERGFREANPSARFRLIPGAGHYAPLTHGKEFASFVREVAIAG